MRTNRPYVQLDPAVIEQARQMDLLSYLQRYEPNNLKRVTGEVYCTREHDSLKISNGKWYWWSRGFGGVSALDYLIIVTETEKSKDEKTGQPEPDIGVQEKAEKDKLLDELMGKPTVIIAAITSRVRKKKKLPTHLYLGQIEGLPANSIILFEQLRTIDKSRLKEHLTHLDEQYLKSLEFPLLISIGVEKRRSL